MLPPRIVLDTNILVSAALNPDGLQRTTLLIAITKPARLYVSAPILEEYAGVLARPSLQNHERRAPAATTAHQEPQSRCQAFASPASATDPDDDKFIECADAARTDYLITGNCRHFPAFWKGTKIITTREFMTILSPHLASG